MTTTTYLYGPSRPSLSHATSHWLVRVGQLVVAVGNRWERHQAEKVLEALPADIRKDIGWPATTEESARR